MELEARPAVAWKPLALPAEHGGWGLALEPVALGLLLAPSAAGAGLAVAALAGFLARHPLRLWLSDRRRGVRYPRTGAALGVFLAYAALALLALGLASVLAGARFWPALAAAAPIALAALAFDARGRSREALPELCGATALGASCGAIALAGGAAPPVAWGAWALLSLRALTSVLYVRARIRLDRGLAAGRLTVLTSHALAVPVAALVAGWAATPWPAVAAFMVLLLRAAHGLSEARRRVRPQVLGYQELAFGLLTLTLLAAGYRLGP